MLENRKLIIYKEFFFLLNLNINNNMYTFMKLQLATILPNFFMYILTISL